MKIRNGFVSNSSSSSFLIRYKKYDGTLLLSDEEVKLLQDYNFRTSNFTSVSNLFYKYDSVITEKNEISYCRNVLCNQYSVASFLLKNKIPFSAICSNGTEWLFYEKDSTVLIRINDYGKYFEMYGKFPTTINNQIEYVDIKSFIEDSSFDEYLEKK